MSRIHALVDIEHELAAGSGATYEEHLREDAVVVVPGNSLDKQATVEAMNASPGWEEFSFEGERMRDLGANAALLTYRFRGLRGDSEYVAILSSVYVEEDGDWKLAFHQQTPITE